MYAKFPIVDINVAVPPCTGTGEPIANVLNLSPGVPVDPVDPVAPVAPVAPVTPSAPVAPVTP